MTSTYCRKTSYTPVVVSVIIAYVYGGIGPTSHRISGMDSRIRPAVRIYECFVEVARPKDNEDAQIKYVYPKDYAWEVDTKRQLPKFVFPNKFVNEQEEHFTFVLTDLDGKYRFGFCRYPPGGGDVAMCFLSDLPWFKVFYQAMDKIRDLRLDHQGEVVEPFLAGFRNHSLPMANDSVISIVPEGIDVGQVFTFALPDLRKLPEIPADVNLSTLYTSLHHNVILHLFANMIFERRIIVTSSRLTSLSAVMHGAVLLLYPLYWQHIFIPITPLHLIEYCGAPMPYLIGVHSSIMEKIRHLLNDAVIVDIDEDSLESPYTEDLNTIPADIIANLKRILKKPSSGYGDNLARAFLLAQVAMLGGYRSSLKQKQDDKGLVFDEESFLKSRPNMEEFLQSLLQFQHFRQFLNSRIDAITKCSQKEKDVFDSELFTYEEGLKGKFSSEQLKGAFDKAVKSSKKMGDRFQKHAKNIVQKIMEHDMPEFSGGGSRSGTFDRGGSFEVERKASTLDSTRISSSSSIDPTVSKSLTIARELRRGKGPPPVIPYQRHKEGKMKLAESLSKQQQMVNRLGGDVPTATMLSLTPPQSRQTASQDSSERASLNSKDSVDLTTENLLDLQAPPPPRPPRHEESSESDPLTSSESDSEIPPTWEKFGDEPPPVPPPRSKLKAPKLIAKQRTSTLIQGSTVDDFGASIAETLYARGKRDVPDSSTLFPTDLEFYKTLGMEKPSSDLPHPMVPASVSRVPCMVPSPAPLVPSPASMISSNPLVPSPTPLLPSPTPLVPTSAPLVPSPAPLVHSPAPLVPSPAPLVPSPAPLVPSPAPLVPSPAPLIPTGAPLVPNPFPLVPLVPCPPVPLGMVPSTSGGTVLLPTFQTTAGVVTSSQSTAPFMLRSQSVSVSSNGHLPGHRGSPTPPGLSSPLREGSAQRLSGQNGSSKMVDTVGSSTPPSSRPPLGSSRATNPFSMTEDRDTAQVRPRLDDPFSDLVKQTMAKTKEWKSQS